MQRRTLLKGGTALFAMTVAGRGETRARSVSVLPDDARFMKLAIDEAAQADFPFGTVIVKEGEVLARGRNRGRVDHDPTAHGEMVAIHAFLAAHGPEALKGTTLYTSGEPCPMCMGAIIWCGIGRVVFAASIEQLSTKIGQIMITAEDVAAKTPFASIDITGGVLSDEAMALFK
jgi:tRNA(Arg) A34 adenosine deaminase TadA